jgi:RNA polymerase-binding protein DksA
MGKQTVAERKRYEILNTLLLERQDEIKNKLRSLRQIVPAEMADVKDEEEQSMTDFVRDMDFALMQMESETLRQINDALVRLDEGTYGTCGDCGENIAEARLKALPFALLCRDCQESLEGEAGQRAASSRPHNAVELNLSISARNDREPAGAGKHAAQLWNYARQATTRPAHPPAAEASEPEGRRVSLRAPIAQRGSRAVKSSRSRA